MNVFQKYLIILFFMKNLIKLNHNFQQEVCLLITIYLTKYQFTNLKIPNTSVMHKFFCSFSNKLSTLFII